MSKINKKEQMYINSVKKSVVTRFSFVTCLVFYMILPGFILGHGPLHEQISELTKRITQDSENALLYLKRGELYRHHRDWSEALADYEHAIKIDPGLALVDLCRGKLMLEAGWFRKAKIAIDRFLTRYPNHSDALVIRARILTKFGKNLAAAEDFTQALSTLSNPKPEYYIERGQAMSLEGYEYIDEAISGLDEGLLRLGQVVTLQLFAIELEIKKENYDAALDRLEQIAVQSARKEKWLIRRGEILQKAGRAVEARMAFKEALNAIESLSPKRRTVKATVELEMRVRAALERQTVK